ncbi:lipopolysaccharide/colanic/teichoic acid biosynthesis glycosyltransferase [Novosphingobium sp. SG751A]|uniref:sugar transferase n=1 Tax=Novosphingobium sp. SG751A TaxID=2587000 RepID=UPI0020A687C5|nr:sugar transferase [Novosphingobium sp. SG751A]NOW47686.1 lipopolysaccharide/colanic/teichoic acid biosynthesis glycosyltransferase [Novosphingobium sp. SG751A]
MRPTSFGLLDEERPGIIRPAAPPRLTPAPAVPPRLPPMRQRRLQSYLALMLGDGLAIVLGYAGAARLAPPPPFHAIVLVPIYWTIALLLPAYALATLTNRLLAPGKAIAALLMAHAALLLAHSATLLSHDAPHRGNDVLAVGAGLGLTMALMIALRLMLRPVVRRRCGTHAQNLLIIDDGGEVPAIPHGVCINAQDHGLRPDLADPHMLDRLGRYMEGMDRVLVSCPPRRREAWSLVFKSANVSGEILDADVRMLDVLGSRRGADYGALVVSIQPLSMSQRATKRAFDVAVAGMAILALAPLLAVVALLIRLGDGGPVLFVQNRTGRNNRFFPIYKFRSMRVERSDAMGARSASRDDDRITPVGRLIRRSSIDELPQLFNVLRGHMSIVGPRPHAIGSLAGEQLFWDVDRRYWLRHAVKPGLTGLAQMRGLRGATQTENDLTRRLQADLEYLDGWTIWRDMAIILGTLRVLIHARAF